jgi:acyl dehydratase
MSDRHKAERQAVQPDSKIFTPADQARFARISADFNPIHLDPVVARRTQMGAPIVHGIHGALWALEALCGSEAISPLGLGGNFLEPIYVGEPATVTLVRRAEGEARLNIVAGGTVATSITVRLGPKGAPVSTPSAEGALPSVWPRIPIELNLEQMQGRAGSIALPRPPDDLATLFPNLCRALSPRRVAGMISLSPLVGMVSPGLHSLLKSFALDFVEGSDALRYTTVDVNKRFRLVRMAVVGPGIAGECLAYARVPPVRQPAIAEIATAMAQDAFEDARVLVVGGSRGLGEVVAKACAAGGADVLITYAIGKGDGERVVEEIAAFGGRAAARLFDINGDIPAQLSDLALAPTHVYYFPSCPTLKRHGPLFSADLSAQYERFYVHGFLATVQALLAQTGGGGLRVFYPSTLVIDQPTRGSAEFAMAKAAGEALCRQMNQYLPGADVVCQRLPRLLTDQTATVSPAEASPVLDIMLPIVREMQAKRVPSHAHPAPPTLRAGLAG